MRKTKAVLTSENKELETLNKNLKLRIAYYEKLNNQKRDKIEDLAEKLASKIFQYQKIEDKLNEAIESEDMLMNKVITYSSKNDNIQTELDRQKIMYDNLERDRNSIYNIMINLEENNL